MHDVTLPEPKSGVREIGTLHARPHTQQCTAHTVHRPSLGALLTLRTVCGTGCMLGYDWAVEQAQQDGGGAAEASAEQSVALRPGIGFCVQVRATYSMPPAVTL